MFASDVTPAVRPYAKTLDDKCIIYHPNCAPGNKPIAVGHAYSVLAYLPEKTEAFQSPWVLPLSVDRVKTSDKGHELGPLKLCELLTENYDFTNQLCVHVGDTAYFTPVIREMISPHENLIFITRLRSNRVVYATPNESDKKKYGESMSLNQKKTHKEPDKKIQLESVTAGGKPIIVEIQIWFNQLFRGTKKFKGYKHPFNLFQLCVYDAKTQKKLFKRPMWLAVSGQRRNELSEQDVYESYKQRYDIEHFFRFGKQKLLMDSFQTPDVRHEENWWQIVQLAYIQLYLSRPICKLIAYPWERYLPKFKQQKEGAIADEVSPSLAQRYFSKILAQIGTPAQDVRKVKPGKGRQKGDIQEKRSVKSILFKSKKNSQSRDKKKSSSMIKEFEKQLKNLKPQKLSKIVDILKLLLGEIKLSKEELLNCVRKS